MLCLHCWVLYLASLLDTFARNDSNDEPALDIGHWVDSTSLLDTFANDVPTVVVVAEAPEAPSAASLPRVAPPLVTFGMRKAGGDSLVGCTEVASAAQRIAAKYVATAVARDAAKRRWAAKRGEPSQAQTSPL